MLNSGSKHLEEAEETEGRQERKKSVLVDYNSLAESILVVCFDSAAYVCPTKPN